MASWFSADFICEECGLRWDELVDRDTKDEPQEVECKHCEHKQTSKRVIAAPMVAEESLPDGWRRKHNDSYKRLREASKIRREEVNLRPDKRSDHRKEINKLKRGKGKA